MSVVTSSRITRVLSAQNPFEIYQKGLEENLPDLLAYLNGSVGRDRANYLMTTLRSMGFKSSVIVNYFIHQTASLNIQ